MVETKDSDQRRDFEEEKEKMLQMIASSDDP